MLILERLKTMAVTFHKLFILTLSKVQYLFAVVMLLSAVWCYTPTKSNDTGFDHWNPMSCHGVFNSNREIMVYQDSLHEGLKIRKCGFMEERKE